MNPLQVPFYASYLIPCMFLALAAQIRRTVESLRHSTVVVLCLAGLWLTADLFCLPHDQKAFHKLCLSTLTDHRPILYVLGATLVAILAVLLSGATRWRAAKGVSLAFLLACLAFLNYTRSLSGWIPDQVRKDAFRAIMDGVVTIRAHGGKSSTVQFWYKPEEGPVACLITSLHCTFLWNYTNYSGEYPQLPRDEAGRPIAPRRPLLIVLGKAPGAFAEARSQLRLVGVDACLVEEKQIAYGGSTYTVTLIENHPLNTPTTRCIPER